MHPNLHQFLERFEREAAQKGHYRSKIGKAEYTFLNEVWGPAFQYIFDGLKAEYPLKDYKGGQRFADFVYIRNGIKLLIEIDGFTTHAREISPGEFDDHLSRQNDLVLSGWLVLRFSAHQVEKRPQICQRQIKQAIGHWWSITQGTLSAKDTERWSMRKQYLIHMALRQNGRISPNEVAAEFQVSNRTASDWLKRFEAQGIFAPAPHAKRIMSYVLTDCTKN